ncbi:MAG: hypothetical protein HQK65_23290 [Desulfamplus sp.]|nr:hypothetical protein [Desulfamplus sp.]
MLKQIATFIKNEYCVIYWTIIATFPIFLPLRNGYALSGAIFQIFGIIVVLLQLHDTTKLFAKLQHTSDIIMELPPSILTIQANCTPHITNCPPTIEDRINFLETRMDNTILELTEKYGQIRKDHKKLALALQQNENDNEKFYHANEKLIEKAVVGNKHSSIISLLWMATGIILSLLN